MMSTTSPTAHRLFALLEGTWEGEGRGEFPGVTSFAYRERLTFTRHSEDQLDYEQQTQKLYDGQTVYLPSHAETGSLQVLEDGHLELVSRQAGRSEILIGSLEPAGAGFRIHFVSKTISDDPRMISSVRIFEVDGHTLRCEMGMHTTKVAQLTPHLKNVLQRVQ